MVEEYEFKQALKDVDRNTRLGFVYINDKVKELASKVTLPPTIPTDIQSLPKQIYDLEKRLSLLQKRFDELHTQLREEYLNPETLNRMRRVQYEFQTTLDLADRMVECVKWMKEVEGVRKMLDKMAENLTELAGRGLEEIRREVMKGLRCAIHQTVSSITTILIGCLQKGKTPSSAEFDIIHEHDLKKYEERGFTPVVAIGNDFLIARILVGGASIQIKEGRPP